jgi:hypothetical protein
MFSPLFACLIAALPSPDSARFRQALESRCLLVVSINAESRVKAERGTAAAELRLNAPTVVVVKVINEGGVTAPLAVAGPGIGPAGWVDARFSGRTRLTGGPIDYLLLELKPREGGRREATFRFDVGQGTQDLGFRAEVPVLFRVRPE